MTKIKRDVDVRGRKIIPRAGKKSNFEFLNLSFQIIKMAC